MNYSKDNPYKIADDHDYHLIYHQNPIEHTDCVYCEHIYQENQEDHE